MNVLKPNKRTTVATLLATGTSQREIARLTGVGRKTIRRLALDQTGPEPNSPTLATGSAAAISSTPATGSGGETPPPRPPAVDSGPQSLYEPHRAFIEAQLRLRRNYTSIYQDLVDQFDFTGRYNSVKRFAGRLVQREPEQFDRLEFGPGEEAQVDYGEGALTRIAGSDKYRRPRLFVMTLRYSRRSFRRVVWKSSKETWAQLHEQGRVRFHSWSCSWCLRGRCNGGAGGRRACEQVCVVVADADQWVVLLQIQLALEWRIDLGQRLRQQAFGEDLDRLAGPHVLLQSLGAGLIDQPAREALGQAHHAAQLALANPAFVLEPLLAQRQRGCADVAGLG